MWCEVPLSTKIRRTSTQRWFSILVLHFHINRWRHWPEEDCRITWRLQTPASCAIWGATAGSTARAIGWNAFGGGVGHNNSYDTLMPDISERSIGWQQFVPWCRTEWSIGADQRQVNHQQYWLFQNRSQNGARWMYPGKPNYSPPIFWAFYDMIGTIVTNSPCHRMTEQLSNVSPQILRYSDCFL